MTSDSHTERLLTPETPGQSVQRGGHESAQSAKSGRTSSEGSAEDSFQTVKLELLVTFGAVIKGPGQTPPHPPTMWHHMTNFSMN